MHHARWMSLLGAVMSIGYTSIAVVMSAIHIAGGGQHAQPAPRPASTASTIFGVFNALGGVAFTFGGQAVLPEIQVGEAGGRVGPGWAGG